MKLSVFKCRDKPMVGVTFGKEKGAVKCRFFHSGNTPVYREPCCRGEIEKLDFN
jgi:hypothetical protein